MKKSIYLILCFCTPAWSTISLVQAKTGTTTSATTCAVTVTAETAGHLLVAAMAATSKPTGVADNAGTVNTFTDNTANDATATGASASIWYKPNCNSGGTTVTFSGMAAGTNGACFVWEFSGAATSSPVDTGNQTNNATSANPESGASITPTNSGDALISVFTTLGGAITAINTPWSGNNLPSGHGQGGASLIPGSVSQETPTYTGDASGNAACSSTVAFLPPASAAVGGVNMQSKKLRLEE